MKYDIIHIFTDEGMYQKRFLEFAENNFDLKNNLFVFRSKESGYDYGNKLNGKIVYIEDFKKFIIKLLPLLYRSKKIVIHYLPLGPSLYIWYAFRFLMKKATWVLWGSDLYFYKDRDHSIKSSIYEFLRKGIIKKISHIACFIKGDYDLVKMIYKTNADYTNICYPLPTDFAALEKIIDENSFITNKSEEDVTCKILIGNSGAETNNHIEILDRLAEYHNENIKLYVPLSYGGNKDYIEKVIQHGNSIFGHKFIALTNLMSVKDYGDFLYSIDAAVMNHKRQQGLGNILSLLYLGKKVFLRNDTTSYKQLKSMGLSVFDINDLENSNFMEIFQFDDELKIDNYNKIKNEFSVQNYMKIWTPIFRIK